MTARRLAVLGAAAICAAGCGSTAASTLPAASASAPVAAVSLGGAEATSRATWAVLPMGATAGPNQFWQLLADTGDSWKLETPPDIATNGAIVLAGLSGTSVITGVRPSLYLGFSPVSRTDDGGQQWTAGPPAAGLADVPDALAANSAGQLLGLSTKGGISVAAAGARTWRPLTSALSLAGTAGRSCGLAAVTAVAYSPAGAPLVGASCRSPGIAGVFAETAGGWRPAGPALQVSLARDQIRILRLVTTASGTTALLQAGTGSSASVLAAWLSAAGRWSLSAPLPLGHATVITSSFGAGGSAAVVLSGRRAETIAGPGAAWRGTPSLPAGRSVAIALPAGQPVTALAADAGTVTIWQLGGGGGQWAKSETIKVPIQYGSSG
jgi:hypothetical protein